MFGPRTVSRPMNRGRVTLLGSPLSERFAVMFCWSPEETLARIASWLLFTSQFEKWFARDTCGSRIVLTVSAWPVYDAVPAVAGAVRGIFNKHVLFKTIHVRRIADRVRPGVGRAHRDSVRHAMRQVHHQRVVI